MIAMAMKSSAEPDVKCAAQPVRSAQRSAGAAVSHPDRIVFREEGRLPAFAAAAAFAKAVAAHFARRQPELLFTARRGAANRNRRMYIDWQRNQQGATTVAAYSPRWRKGAPVSTPVAWSELGKLDLRGARFNLGNALMRYRRIDDPWLQQPCRAQSLSAALQRELERRTA